MGVTRQKRPGRWHHCAWQPVAHMACVGTTLVAESAGPGERKDLPVAAAHIGGQRVHGGLAGFAVG